MLETARWSPYLCGAGIGVLCWLAFLFSGGGLGASGAYATAAGLLERLARGPQKSSRQYYDENPPQVNWGLLLLVGVVVGAVTSSMMAGRFEFEAFPQVFQARFGDSWLTRLGTGFFGGALLAFGARMAGGCTSGNGITGTMQLVVGSWLAAACFFIGGIATAFLLYA